MSIKGDVLPGGINQEIQGVTTHTRAHPDDFNPNVLKPLLDNDVTLSKQLETLPFEALTFRPGYQIVESEQDTPFRLGEIKGRTLVNLLGRAGAFDSMESWQIYGGKGNVDKGICTITGSGSVANPQAGNLNIGYTPEVGELLFVRANCSVDNEKCTEVGLYLYAANTTPGRIYADRLKNPSPNQTYTMGGIIRVTQNMIDNWAGMRIVIAYEYKFAENALNTVNKLNKVAMYKVPESVSGLSVSALLAKYPYVDAMTNVKNPYAIVTGGNLLPPFYEWEDHTSGFGRIESPYSCSIEGAASVGRWYQFYAPALPNATYTLTGEVSNETKFHAIFCDKDKKVVDETRRIGTFTTSADTAYIRVLANTDTGIGLFTFKKPMLTIGTEPKPFTPQQRSMLAFETELAAHPIDGSNPDTLFMGDDGLPYVLEPWGKITLDGSLEWKDPGSAGDFTIVGASLGQAAGFDVLDCVKFDGTFLTKHSDMIKGDNAYFIIASQHKEFRISIPNSDSGWGPGYTPEPDEIKAYFFGWKMYDTSGTDPTAIGTYNRTDGRHKGWTPLQSFDGTKYEGGYNGSGTPSTFPNTSNTTYYQLNRTWQPYRLQYLKAKPTVEPIRNYEKGATLCGGSNMVEVGSGLVIRERANPGRDYTGTSHVQIGRVDYGSATKFRVSHFLEVFRNSHVDTTKWRVFTIDDGASFGNERLIAEPENFDFTAVYRVTYTMLDPTLAAPISGTVAANLHGTVTDLVQDVGDVQRRLSVVETQKAEKDVPQWIQATLLNGWEGFIGGRIEYTKDPIGFVHIRGMAQSGNVGQAIFKLPIGYRPNAPVSESSLSFNGAIQVPYRLDINRDGVVSMDGGGNFWVIVNATFQAEQ